MPSFGEKTKIPFSKRTQTDKEMKYLAQAMEEPSLSGDGHFSRLCRRWLRERMVNAEILLVPSCSHALELTALLIEISPGDEVIMSSYTDVSTANAFALRGAKIVFVDIRPDTMNLDENKIEACLTKRTKAIVPVHYGGVACDMTRINEIAEEHGLIVVEDAAHAMMARYKSRPLGTWGHFGAISFHESKNYSSGGRGGVLIINEPRFVERARIIRQKGTNREQFYSGDVEKYRWMDVGSSFVMGEIHSAILWAQLEEAELILQNRLTAWNRYRQCFQNLVKKGDIEISHVPNDCEHNGHLFFIKCDTGKAQQKLLGHLASQGIGASFHYVPLHSTQAGEQFGRFNGEDLFTTIESDRLVRLPIFNKITAQEQAVVVKKVEDFF